MVWWNRFRWMIVTWFGLGYSPKISGTVGTLGAIPLVWWLGPHTHAYLYVGLILLGMGIYFSSSVVKILGQDDPSCVVIDEVLGYMVSCAFLPLNAVTIISAFVFFRLFDIWKPFPVRQLERLPGGWGIVCDDLMAGVYAHVCVQVLLGFIS